METGTILIMQESAFLLGRIPLFMHLEAYSFIRKISYKLYIFVKKKFMYNSFQIFIPDYNKFTLSINLVYYPLLAVFIILFLNLRLEPYHSIINFILIFFAIIYIYLGATRPFRTKPIKGKLEGLIIFEKESLACSVALNKLKT